MYKLYHPEAFFDNSIKENFFSQVFLKAKPENPTFILGRFFFTLQVLSQMLVRVSEYVSIAVKIQGKLKKYASNRRQRLYGKSRTV